MSGSGSTATNSVWLNNTVGNDATWSTPYLMPVAGATPAPDDISAVVAYGGNKIGVMWSNQKDESMYWAVHIDGQAATQWKGSQAIKGHGVADDHINLKSVQSDANGRVWAALKTSFDDVGTSLSDPLMQLLVFRPATNDWLVSTFATVGDCQTRPMVVLDSEHQTVHMFAVGPTAAGCPYSGYAGTVYEKSAPMSNPVFGTGRGTRVLQNGASSFINNLTTTKQDVTGTTGLVVLASDDTTNRYWHLDETLGAPPPVPVAAFAADVTSGVAPINVTFTDQSTNTPTAWSWSFGDGATSLAQSPTHSYTATGTYTVKLTVSNAGGSGSMTKTGYITITAPPPSAYTLAVLADSPVSYWRLGETSGTAMKDLDGDERRDLEGQPDARPAGRAHLRPRHRHRRRHEQVRPGRERGQPQLRRRLQRRGVGQADRHLRHGWGGRLQGWQEQLGRPVSPRDRRHEPVAGQGLRREHPDRGHRADGRHDRLDAPRPDQGRHDHDALCQRRRGRHRDRDRLHQHQHQHPRHRAARFEQL